MSDQLIAQVGSIDWADLTVENAEQLRDFYREITGWTVSEVEMGRYRDYCLNEPGTEKPVAGICHARGSNTDLPPVWLMYINVADLELSLKRCLELGGKVLSQPKAFGGQGKYSVIRDPAGAIIALFEPVNSHLI